MAAILSVVTSVVSSILLALVVFLVGRFIIRKLVKWLDNSRMMEKLDPSLHTFLVSFVRIGLFVLLVIAIISILGVPMASVVTVLASAGLAIGMALQGSLANLAGGIMLMIFKPFKVGEYVETAGASGNVTKITMFYTVITTLDNKRITVPNGALMNANVVNFSAEPLRRVDLTFTCAKSENAERIQDLCLAAIATVPKALKDPEPFARVSGGTNEAMEFTVRAWCESADYWDVYFDVTQAIVQAFGREGVQAPALRVLSEQK
jgi:small conductance mechanosensitive channel